VRPAWGVISRVKVPSCEGRCSS